MVSLNGEVMLNFLSPPTEFRPASASLNLAWDPRQTLSRSQSSIPSTPIFLQTLLTPTSPCHQPTVLELWEHVQELPNVTAPLRGSYKPQN